MGEGEKQVNIEIKESHKSLDRDPSTSRVQVEEKGENKGRYKDDDGDQDEDDDYDEDFD